MWAFIELANDVPSANTNQVTPCASTPIRARPVYLSVSVRGPYDLPEVAPTSGHDHPRSIKDSARWNNKLPVLTHCVQPERISYAEIYSRLATFFRRAEFSYVRTRVRVFFFSFFLSSCETETERRPEEEEIVGERPTTRREIEHRQRGIVPSINAYLDAFVRNYRGSALHRAFSNYTSAFRSLQWQRNATVKGQVHSLQITVFESSTLWKMYVHPVREDEH